MVMLFDIYTQLCIVVMYVLYCTVVCVMRTVLLCIGGSCGLLNVVMDSYNFCVSSCVLSMCLSECINLC